jgi:hypothetical protein
MLPHKRKDGLTPCVGKGWYADEITPQDISKARAFMDKEEDVEQERVSFQSYLHKAGVSTLKDLEANYILKVSKEDFKTMQDLVDHLNLNRKRKRASYDPDTKVFTFINFNKKVLHENSGLFFIEATQPNTYNYDSVLVGERDGHKTWKKVFH